MTFRHDFNVKCSACGGLHSIGYNEFRTRNAFQIQALLRERFHVKPPKSLVSPIYNLAGATPDE